MTMPGGLRIRSRVAHSVINKYRTFTLYGCKRKYWPPQRHQNSVPGEHVPDICVELLIAVYEVYTLCFIRAVVADTGVQLGLVQQCVASVIWNSRTLCHCNSRPGPSRCPTYAHFCDHYLQYLYYFRCRYFCSLAIYVFDVRPDQIYLV